MRFAPPPRLSLLVLALSLPVLAGAAPAPRPAAVPDLATLVASNKDASTFTKLLRAAGLMSLLHQAGPYTLLVPVNAAFDKLPKGTVALWLKPANKAKLKGILLYHIAKGKYTGAAVLRMKSPATITTLQGKRVTVTHKGLSAKVNSAKVIKGDFKARNGVAHAIDRVLIPPQG